MLHFYAVGTIAVRPLPRLAHRLHFLHEVVLKVSNVRKTTELNVHYSVSMQKQEKCRSFDPKVIKIDCNLAQNQQDQKFTNLT